MVRVQKVRFRSSRNDLDRLFSCNRLSAEVWNKVLELASEHHQETGQWISKTELQTATRKINDLHSKSIQAVAHRYCWNRGAAKTARDQGHTKTRYPYKKKNYLTTKWDQEGNAFNPDFASAVGWSS